ncbi:MAG TPA: STAS domain-containing protein [Bacillales bacterium]|nr:STAS domain-containing protein [Bacillales bacterium]
MKDSVIQLIKNEKQGISDSWEREMREVREEYRLQHISDEVFVSTNRRLFELIWEHIGENVSLSMTPFKELIDRLLEIGLPLNYLIKGLQTFRRQLQKTAFQQMEEADQLHEFFTEVDDWYDPILNQLVTASVQTWENTVTSQRTALKELSAPLIPVFEGISVMPLIGTIDTERAKLIMENLLEGVIEHRSQVVLIDITGVPVVDTMVAHHIIQAAEAVRLVGAKSILVGIRPEIAQTIVTLGIDLSDFPTKSTLQKGMQSALEMTGREMVEGQQEGSR